MPRYSSRDPSGFKSLNSVQRQTVFVRNLGEENWNRLQKIAGQSSATDIHDGAFSDIANASSQLHLIHGLWGEHKARAKGEKTGGGLGDAVNWIARTVSSPFRAAWNIAKNYAHNNYVNTVTNHTRLVARMLKQTYITDIDKRKTDMGTYERIEDMSTDFIDVWEDDERDQILVTVRGSINPEDWLVDDAKILVTGKPRNKIAKQLQKVFDKYEKTNDIECAGHSLGASLLATAVSESDLQPDRIDLFSPGTSFIPGTSDPVGDVGKRPNTWIYANAADPVSAGALGESHTHLVLNAPQSFVNPIANHSLDQWIVPPNP